MLGVFRGLGGELANCLLIAFQGSRLGLFCGFHGLLNQSLQDFHAWFAPGCGADRAHGIDA